jgi:hypothetical protein
VKESTRKDIARRFPTYKWEFTRNGPTSGDPVAQAEFLVLYMYLKSLKIPVVVQTTSPHFPIPAEGSNIILTPTDPFLQAGGYAQIGDLLFGCELYIYQDERSRLFNGKQRTFGKILCGVTGRTGLWSYRKNIRTLEINLYHTITGVSITRPMCVPTGHPQFFDTTNTFYLADGKTRSAMIHYRGLVHDTKFLIRLEKLTDKQIWVSGHDMEIQFDQEKIYVPVPLFTWAVKYLTGKTIEKDTIQGFRALLKMQIKKIQEAYPFSETEFFLNYLAFEQLVIQCVTSKSVQASKWNNRVHEHNVSFYNRIVAGEYLNSPRVTYYTGLVKAVFKHLLCNWFSLAIMAVPLTVVFWLSVIYFFFRGVGACTPSTVLVTSTIGINILLAWLAFTFCVSLYKTWKYGPWDRFKTHVEGKRQSYPVTCAVRPLDGFQEFTSWVDIEEYALNPDASYEAVFFRDKIKRSEVAGRNGTVIVGPIFCSRLPLVFKNNPDNSTIGLFTRVLLDPPTRPIDRYFNDMMRSVPIAIRKGDKRGPVPINKILYDGLGGSKTWHTYSFEEYVKRFPAAKRNKILKRLEEIQHGGNAKQDYVYQAFVKREKQMEITYEDYKPIRPRIIQGCSNGSKAQTGQWFYNYQWALKFAWQPVGQIWFCSGYTSKVFNGWIKRAVSSLGGLAQTLFIGSDFSKYDVTQGKTCIDNEIRWYQNLGCPFHKYLSSKYYTVGYVAGIMYELLGCRKSGDNDTSSGNSRNTGLAIASFFARINFTKWRAAVLGDDNFTVVHQSILKIFKSISNLKEQLVEHMTKLGYSVKLMITEKIMETEFLSMRFYPLTECDFAVGKKPGRVLCKIGHFLNGTKRSMEEWMGILKGTLISMRNTAMHVPFLRKYIEVVTKHIKEDPIYPQEFNFQGIEEYKATAKTWAEFESVYKLSIADEKAFTKLLEDCITKYGLQCIIHSPFVDRLVEVEDIL